MKFLNKFDDTAQCKNFAIFRHFFSVGSNILCVEKLLLCAIVVIFIFYSQNVFGYEGKNLGSIFGDSGIFIETAEDFIVQKSILREGLENSFWTITAKNQDNFLKIEVIKNINRQYARQYIKERMYIIDSLYNRFPSAYPGMVSQVIECPDRFKPEVMNLKVEDENVSVWLLHSTSRLIYGACTEDLIKYRGAATFIYHEKEKTLYRLDIFIPKDKFNRAEVLKMLGSIKLYRKSGYSQTEAKDVNRNIPVEKKGEIKKENARNFNLIIIGFDPLGANHMSSYGYPRKTTPHLDQFAKESVLFTNAISPSSWTLPVFMSWFTSLYPSQHKIVNKYSKFSEEERAFSNLGALSPSVITLAQVMKENGYATAGFTGDAGVNSVFGYSLGFDEYYDETKFGVFDDVLPKALGWLKEHGKQKFFLFVQAYDVHGRARLPEGFKNKFKDPSYQGKYQGTSEEYWNLRNLSLDQNDIGMEVEDVNFWESWYDAKIYEADKRIGDFFTELRSLGFLENTVILVSSASGNEFYEHKRFDHGYSLYEELIRVPLMIKVPGEKHRIVQEQVRTIDIMPTVLDFLNIERSESIAKQMQGVSLRPLMAGNKLQLDAFSETDYLLHAFKRSIRTADGWKLIYSLDTEERELYNLNADPEELYNLIEEEGSRAYELEQRLFYWIQSIGQEKRRHKNILQGVFQ